MGFDVSKLKDLAASAGTVIDQALVYPVSEMHTLHIDGDYAAYFFAGNDELPLGTAKENMVNSFKAAAAVLGVFDHNVTVHITDPMSDKGGRYKIATVRGYQEKRTHSQRPKNWQALRTYLHEGLPGSGLKVVNWTDREADDGASVASAEDMESGKVPGLYYRDKDWRMIPGRHIRWTDFEVFEVKPDTYSLPTQDGEDTVYYGPHFFWLQMLMGDGVDNIPGLEKIAYVNSKGKEATKLCGEVCANDVLAGSTSNATSLSLVAQAYEGFYGPGWETRFAEQAMLLWLRSSKLPHIDNYMQLVDQSSDHYVGLTKANAFIKRRIK